MNDVNKVSKLTVDFMVEEKIIRKVAEPNVYKFVIEFGDLCRKYLDKSKNNKDSILKALLEYRKDLPMSLHIVIYVAILGQTGFEISLLERILFKAGIVELNQFKKDA